MIMKFWSNLCAHGRWHSPSCRATDAAHVHVLTYALFFCRGYPGGVFQKGDGSQQTNVLRKPWYTRALAQPSLVTATNPYTTESDDSMWMITLSKALRVATKDAPVMQPYGEMAQLV